VAIFGGSDRCLSLAYPPGTDQQSYLEAGISATHGLLPDRGPLYSVWMAALFELAGPDLHRTFQVEKLVTTLALALTAGLVAGRIFGGATGLLVGAWVMNCKYLLHESNGSHTFAAVVWMTGLLVLLSSLGPRRPLALIVLFLATQVRTELWVPFLLAAAGVIAREWNVTRRKVGGRPLALSWAAALLIGVAAWAALHANTYRAPMQVGVRLAFQQGFAVTYVDRHDLRGRFPRPLEGLAGRLGGSATGRDGPGFGPARAPEGSPGPRRLPGRVEPPGPAGPGPRLRAALADAGARAVLSGRSGDARSRAETVLATAR
jgi:hypothetical protein